MKDDPYGGLMRPRTEREIRRTTRLYVQMPHALHEWLSEYAFRHNLTMTEVVERALKKVLTRLARDPQSLPRFLPQPASDDYASSFRVDADFHALFKKIVHGLRRGGNRQVSMFSLTLYALNLFRQEVEVKQ